jgi:uncharacterized membrane protein YqiK
MNAHGSFSPYPYIAVVVVVILVNLFLLVRFLIKASKWGRMPDDKE